MTEHKKCPQCNKDVEVSSCRLVQDSCGHKKCRICLLNDENECFLCKEESETNKSKKNPHDDNHTAVITFKGKNCKSSSGDAKITKLVTLEEKRNYQTMNVPTHISIAPGYPPVFLCTICKRKFKTRSHVKYHQYCVGGAKPLKCNICNKEFISKSHFKVHVSGHVNKNSHGCETCGKKFSQRAKLKRHALLHNDTRPFVCQKCGGSFRTRDTLKIHSYIHTGEKPFQCKQCNARFNNSSNLKKHLVTHSDEEGHMCDVCGKRFKLKSTLAVHQRTHSNLRPYTCTTCSKTFINSKDLQRHNLIHLDEKAYTCCICNTGFRRKDNLDRHMRNTHPGKKPVFTKKIVRRSKIMKSFPPAVVDNPNAINVITVSPVCTNPPLENPVNSHRKGKPVPVINAPLKLAFKTSAFKNSYNIHRDYVAPADDVNIYEKIFLPHHTLPSKVIDRAELVADDNNFQLPSPKSSNCNESEPHAVIKNIKFKVPPKYVSMAPNGEDKSYVELKPPPPVPEDYCADNTSMTSVIVNAPPLNPPPQFGELHWRKRTSQIFNLYHHFKDS